MIAIGMTKTRKIELIDRYRKDHSIKKIFVLTPETYDICLEYAETVSYPNIIEYKYFYRLMQEVDQNTLVVVNECLRTQNRYDLTYNCIRNFLNQTRHQLIFQTMPIIDQPEDFLILVDFDTQSRYKRDRNMAIIRHADIVCLPQHVRLNPISVPVTLDIQARYQAEKKKLFDTIGLKDPHTIPRNLYLVSGKAKMNHIHPDVWYVGRNNRFKIERFQTFREKAYPHNYTVFEFCHNFIDFSDFVALSNQRDIPVLVADLKVDHWYFERYTNWVERIADVYSKIQQHQKRA